MAGWHIYTEPPKAPRSLVSFFFVQILQEMIPSTRPGSTGREGSAVRCGAVTVAQLVIYRNKCGNAVQLKASAERSKCGFGLSSVVALPNDIDDDVGSLEALRRCRGLACLCVVEAGCNLVCVGSACRVEHHCFDWRTVGRPHLLAEIPYDSSRVRANQACEWTREFVSLDGRRIAAVHQEARDESAAAERFLNLICTKGVWRRVAATRDENEGGHPGRNRPYTLHRHGRIVADSRRRCNRSS
jgi:hypothetical protein